MEIHCMKAEKEHELLQFASCPLDSVTELPSDQKGVPEELAISESSL